jgi:predicted acylesterase/phospholipase RssA
MYRAVAASAAFPFVFRPVELHLGQRVVPAVDGGAVNNAPLLHALAGAPEVDRVFVITSFPRVFSGPVPLRGLGYASHLADVLIEERMFRDLRDADRQTHALRRLAELPLDRSTRHAVLDALGWTGRRPVTIVEIRPDSPLDGNAFTGFVSRRLRESYVTAGLDAGRRAVASITRATSNTRA